MLEQTNLTSNDSAADSNGEDLFDAEDFLEETTDVDPFEEDSADDAGSYTQGQNAAGAGKPSGTAAAKTAAGAAQAERITVRYNGKDVAMTLDELKTNAQKGLNYDHIKSERDALKNSRTSGLLEDLAKRSGVRAEDYLTMIQEAQQQQNNQNLIRQGVPMPVIKRINELEGRELQRAAQERETAIKQQQDRMYEDFYEAYPDLDPYTIPGEVWDMAEMGHDLLSVYRAYENRQLKAQLQMHQQNQKNRNSTVGSVQTDAEAAVADAFLSGLMGL